MQRRGTSEEQTKDFDKEGKQIDELHELAEISFVKLETIRKCILSNN